MKSSEAIKNLVNNILLTIKVLVIIALGFIIADFIQSIN